MSPSQAEGWRGPVRWLGGGALLALAPKCLVCLAAYAGVGALFGVRLGGPELCGAAAGPSGGTVVALAVAGAAGGGLVWRRVRRMLRVRNATVAPQANLDCHE